MSGPTFIAAACLFSISLLLNGVAISAPQEGSPVAYHLSFDDWSFLDDDYSARFPEPPLEWRNLKLVSGKFGQALANENTFSPADFEKMYMSTRDLDMLLEVICYHRFKYYELQAGGNEPYFWGTGRLKTDSGTLAFWAKGKRAHPGRLFFQGTSSFGRLEKYLLGIDLNEDQTLTAYLVDARYHRHTIRSSAAWKDNRFNHVALVWNRAQGLILYLNGEPIASNWGQDAWWTTQMPGLFHLPMCGLTLDELWILDRATTGEEVRQLMSENRLPANGGSADVMDDASAIRLRKAFVGAGESRLPRIGRDAGDGMIIFDEVLPTWIGDGCVAAPTLMDGRYEMAWPMGYTSFTNILGDSDYQPEKVDIRLPQDAVVNYITMEGNLAEARLMIGENTTQSTDRMAELFTVPQDGRFCHAQTLADTKNVVFRLPFIKNYGSPPGYAEGLYLPLTGDIRIHETAFFCIHKNTRPLSDRQVYSLYIGDPFTVPNDGRIGYALRAMNDRQSSTILNLCSRSTDTSRRIATTPFARINLLSEPLDKPRAIKALDFTLSIRDASPDELLIVRIHDTGVPARIWTSVVFQIIGFEGEGGLLCFRLDMIDLRAAAGDRLWIDIAFGSRIELEIGGKSSFVSVEAGDLPEADTLSSTKALQPALSSLTKIYYWYYPWILTKKRPDPDHPVTFGGYYDIVNCSLALLRTAPDDYLANILRELALVDYSVEPDRTFKSWENCPEFWPPIRTSKADESPDWAYYMNYYLSRFEEIVHDWADRQNPDGQVGGGWNDDVLFASRLSGPLLYSGDRQARQIFDRIFEGLETTRMFHDGYCHITPLDAMHIEDLVRNRYEGLLFAPGDPRKMKIAMRTAWHLNKPDQTPMNYGDGQAFKYDHDLILWYWGRTPAYPAYSVTREQITARMKELAPAMNDVLRFRYTDAGMYTDGALIPGSYDVKRYLLGGNWGPFLEQLSLAVSWEEGGDALIPKWIEQASDTALYAHLYSYDSSVRAVTARLYRLKRGVYRITLAGEGKDASKGIVLLKEMELRRFSKVTVPLRPAREMVLRIELLHEIHDSGPRADLAVGEVALADGFVRAELLNFGTVASGPFTVALLDASGSKLAEQTVNGLESAEDFTPGRSEVKFPVDPHAGGICAVIVDPADRIEEITNENNLATVPCN